MTAPAGASFLRCGSLRRAAFGAPLLLLAFLPGCAPPPSPRAAPLASFQQSMDAVLDTPPLDQIHWGVLAVDLRSGQVLFERNARRKFVPASNAKILVTAAALLEMGPDFRFSTEVWGVGTLDGDGILEGDLVIPGDGDPTLSSRYWEDDEAPLRALADSIAARGVGVVRGRLVVDASAWDTAAAPSSWMIGNLPWGFSAVGGPFSLSEGTTRIVVEAASPGEPARVRWVPLGRPDFVDAAVRTVVADDSTAEVRVSWLPEAGRHHLRGTISQGRVDTLSISTRVPAEEGAHALVRWLDDAGVSVEGGVVVIPEGAVPIAGGCASGAVRTCASATLLARLPSPPLSKVVKGILEPSQNWMTEQLVRALSVHRGGRGSWEEGLDAVEATLRREVGVDSLDLSLRDGSGLSAYSLVTPSALAAVLRRMADSPMAALYRDALAAPGEKGSTLEDRLMELEGRVQAKTGTISNVNSLSGYLVSDSGREIVFSILTNGSGLPSGVVRERMDEVVRTLARYH